MATSMEQPDDVSAAVDYNMLPLPGQYAQLMIMLYDYMLKFKIERIMTDTCSGCQNNGTDPMDHMAGCLRIWEDGVDAHLALAQVRIDAPLLAETYRTVLKALDLPPPAADIGVAAEQLLQMTSATVAAKVQKSDKGPWDLPIEYHRVFMRILN